MIMHNEEKTFIVILIIWAIGALLTLSFWGFVIWVIIKLMTHFGVI